jgi:hypothetical protein
MAWLFRTPILGLATAGAVMALSVVPLGATGQLDVVAKFQRPSLQLDVATYVDPDAEAPDGKVGLIGFASGGVRNSIALRPDEWIALVSLWAKATRMQSPRSWRTVGALTEKTGGDATRVTVLAGSGVKVALISAKGAGMTYLVSRAEVPRFGAAIRQVLATLAPDQASQAPADAAPAAERKRPRAVRLRPHPLDASGAVPAVRGRPLNVTRPVPAVRVRPPVNASRAVRGRT